MCIRDRNNETYVVGNTPSTVLTVENTGSEDLTISSVSFSGTNSGDFSTDLNPTVIGAFSSENFSLNYAASTIGSVSATLTIGNDDGDENPLLDSATSVLLPVNAGALPAAEMHGRSSNV